MLAVILLSMMAFVEEAASSGSSVIWTVAGAAIAALASTGIGALAIWLKNLSWIKKMRVDKLIDRGAEIAINYAESWGRTKAADGAAKLNIAKEAFQAEMARQGIKLDAGQIEKRLEAIFNKIKEKIEHKSGATPLEPKIGTGQ